MRLSDQLSSEPSAPESENEAYSMALDDIRVFEEAGHSKAGASEPTGPGQTFGAALRESPGFGVLRES